jgi:hypothetical protein
MGSAPYTAAGRLARRGYSCGLVGLLSLSSVSDVERQFAILAGSAVRWPPPGPAKTGHGSGLGGKAAVNTGQREGLRGLLRSNSPPMERMSWSSTLRGL